MSLEAAAARGWFLVHGYALRIGVTSAHEDRTPIRLTAGCFNLLRGWPFLCFMHEPSRKFAWQGNGSLKIDADSYGLRFAAAVSYDEGHQLLGGIHDGRFNNCSVMINRHQSEYVHENGHRVELISKCSISEITICPQGAIAGSVCWLGDLPREEIRPECREAYQQWHKNAADAPAVAAAKAKATARLLAEAQAAASRRLADRTKSIRDDRPRWANHMRSGQFR